jgi:16S rRNA (guanine(966)-N(2))-methyltransferase RsmD
VRIISGRFRGRRLAAPPSRRVRPTPDRVREALFSILGRRVQDAHVLDLYAGTGALGLEALSRGAARAVFVDSHPNSVDMVRKNIRACGLQEGTVRVLCMSALAAVELLQREEETFHLIFMDPPYGKGLVPKTLEPLHKVSTPDTLVVAEHAPQDPVPSPCHGWTIQDQRRYGDTTLSFFVLP